MKKSELRQLIKEELQSNNEDIKQETLKAHLKSELEGLLKKYKTEGLKAENIQEAIDEIIEDSQFSN